ncbi:uncharacterized protein K452DRAFT_285074 [Aplosporella prunicola CBS 121167]|uniref:RNA-dependent RNA polymerase n=1 Tax=Aplosporella prunicola CBS 121167 TaxID=1176127 RepID=A0A6A6BKW9_9PEZI|nr:uncharacterized protein K452DRAFT_285074 [Aplosporella prunicola CBS 121167]KAF2144749.1 hypothetical protein K452DRAFT_285074 [Aplosporella prunicola CBS 121167]
MDIFVRGMPISTTEKSLTDFFKSVLEQLHVFAFNCKKIKNKAAAILTIADHGKAELFLKTYGLASDPQRRNKTTVPLIFINKPLTCVPSQHKPDDVVLKALIYEESQRLQKIALRVKVEAAQPVHTTQSHPLSTGKKVQKSFDFSSISCGVWDYNGSQAAFAPHYHDSRCGTAMFGKHALALILRADGWVSHTCRIDIPYWSIDTIVTGGQLQPTATFTLRFAPKVYKMEEGLEGLMAGLGINSSTNKRHQKNTRSRVCAINEAHEVVIGSCWVYQVSLTNPLEIVSLYHLLNRNPGMPSAVTCHIACSQVHPTFKSDFERLKELLFAGRQFGNLPFPIKFQVERLARNAFLAPAKIVSLLPKIKYLRRHKGVIPTTMAIRTLSRQIQYPGPHVDPKEFEINYLAKALEQNAEDFRLEGSIYDVNTRHHHIALIHRVVVTPAGTYLEGPEPEVSNRVLRMYPNHTNHFLRVQFTDEDLDSLKFEARTNMSEVYHGRFKQVLDGMINIGGHGFQFLGFSHSSLRSQTCWFMAPFVSEGSLIAAQEIIKELGDFSEIRSPAKCAARIGQAFSDTANSVNIDPSQFQAATDVVRNGRTFSDGVGTISLKLLRKVWKVYSPIAKNQRPTCLQIRFAGAKGMVSLDTRLAGEQLVIRESMMKFKGGKALNIEICGASFKPLPMYLNRQFILILEDLGVPAQVFLTLQAQAIEQLRRITLSPVNAATFLEHAHIGQAARLPPLIRMLDDLGLPFNEDDFLEHVVEIAALASLRDLKYRSRILVEHGVTLYGIMDETGILEEGEIFCVTEKPGGGRRILQGRVIVTRAPAMHPGDVQFARAVDVPSDSPLNSLSNCVVFSQKGQRDLPSQLSGGDLDGDLYNVIFDKRLMPKVTYTAADYPRVAPLDIGREVNKQDMTNFFVKFMETDQLGRISMIHMQLADRKPGGTRDPDCITLAEMASVAVDFSKTGIPVDMLKCPKYDMIRPDFMASGPRVIVEKKGAVFEEEEDDDEDDAIQVLDPDFKTYRYYESERALGQLYRAIDEKKFFEEMQARSKGRVELHGDKYDLMSEVWSYVVQETQLIQWESYSDLAREIRETYESNLLDVMSDYSTHPQYPLSELEVFGGNIIGKSMGGMNKRVREITTAMNERFERDVAFTVERITQGDDGDRDEALARSIACLAVAVLGPKRVVNRRVGELRSWKYVAAAVCLREIELFKMRFDPLNRTA